MHLQVDLSVTSNFNLLRLRPIVYNLQTFGIASEPDRIYDYRFEQKIDRSRLRDTANNVLFQQAQTAEMLASVNGSGGNEVENEAGDEVSTLGGFEDDATNDGTVASTAKKLRSKLGTMKISASQMDMTLEAAKAVAAYHQSNIAPPGTAASDSTQLSTVRKLDDKGREIVADSRLYGPSRQRLISKFPVRDKRDRSTNYFESRMVGIGAAKEEDEMKLQDALKKQQVNTTMHFFFWVCVLTYKNPLYSYFFKVGKTNRRAPRAARRSKEEGGGAATTVVHGRKLE